MKHKAGDKVRIRKDLKADVQYGSKGFTNSMCKYRGKETTITKVLSNFYTLKVDDGMWAWSEEMLEESAILSPTFKVGDKVIMNPERSGRLGVLTITSIGVGLPTFYKLSDSNGNSVGEWLATSIIKVPLFKIGQIVRFKNIKDDKWYSGTNEMANIEGKCGIITKVTENRYVADKQGQDGCIYEVKDLRDGGEWCVTSASIEPVQTVASLENITQYNNVLVRNDSELLALAAVAQAVDNVKGPQFKIGDRVLIREDLVPGKKYEEWDYSPEDGMGGWEFAAAMAKYMGKVATITGYVADDPNYFHLDIDKGTYSWIVNALLHYTPGSDYDLDKTIITNKQQTKQNHENRLQEKGPVIAGRERQSGCAVRYPGEQIRVGISNLGYRKITCKRQEGS